MFPLVSCEELLRWLYLHFNLLVLQISVFLLASDLLVHVVPCPLSASKLSSTRTCAQSEAKPRHICLKSCSVFTEGQMQHSMKTSWAQEESLHCVVNWVQMQVMRVKLWSAKNAEHGEVDLSSWSLALSRSHSLPLLTDAVCFLSSSHSVLES